MLRAGVPLQHRAHVWRACAALARADGAAAGEDELRLRAAAAAGGDGKGDGGGGSEGSGGGSEGVFSPALPGEAAAAGPPVGLREIYAAHVEVGISRSETEEASGLSAAQRRERLGARISPSEISRDDPRLCPRREVEQDLLRTFPEHALFSSHARQAAIHTCACV